MTGHLRTAHTADLTPAELRRRGHGGRVTGALEKVIDRAYDLGALSAGGDGARP